MTKTYPWSRVLTSIRLNLLGMLAQTQKYKSIQVQVRTLLLPIATINTITTSTITVLQPNSYNLLNPYQCFSLEPINYDDNC